MKETSEIDGESKKEKQKENEQSKESIPPYNVVQSEIFSE
jgi:hypothetical protein